MALIKCPDCGRDISSSAPSCIFCGRPLDDLPKKVIRKCGTGEIVVLKRHMTTSEAQKYIDHIMTSTTYRYSYMHESGSSLLVIPDDEPCDEVTDLKNVITIPTSCSDWIVCQEDHLTLQEAMLCKEHLIHYFSKNDPNFDGTGVEIVDVNAPIRYHNPNFTFDTYVNQPATQPAGPRCPTCGSTSIERISTTAKAAGAFAFGLFSKTARSQFKCNNCGYKW